MTTYGPRLGLRFCRVAYFAVVLTTGWKVDMMGSLPSSQSSRLKDIEASRCGDVVVGRRVLIDKLVFNKFLSK